MRCQQHGLNCSVAILLTSKPVNTLNTKTDRLSYDAI